MSAERARFQEMILNLEKQVKERDAEIERLLKENKKLKEDLEAALNGKPVMMPPPKMEKPPPQAPVAAAPVADRRSSEPEVVVKEVSVGVPGAKYTDQDLQQRISEAMKELRTKMAAMETENNKLKKRIEELEKENTA